MDKLPTNKTTTATATTNTIIMHCLPLDVLAIKSAHFNSRKHTEFCQHLQSMFEEVAQVG